MGAEAKIQKKIMDFLTSRGAVCNKTIGMSKAGWPDIIGVYEGRFIGIEVKQPGKKATKLQEFKLNELESAGGYVCVGVSVDDVRKLLAEIDTQLS